jgi:Fe-S-cluster containining protein
MSNPNTAAWLDEFNRRFEQDVRKLHRKEPFWAVCQHCPDGYCCSKTIYATQQWSGNPYLIEDWSRMLVYVRDIFSNEDKARLGRNIASGSGQCIFTYRNRCSIYPVRPWSCRTHPYTVSFHADNDLFPSGEIALPSCPALCRPLGLKKDELMVSKAVITERDPDSSLVKLRIRKHKPVWVIDATEYVMQYEKNAPPPQKPDSEWMALFDLAQVAGSGCGDILSSYVQETTRLKPDRR